jgi:hypothetical protein
MIVLWHLRCNAAAATEEGNDMSLKLTAIASLTVFSLVAVGCSAGPEARTTPAPTPTPTTPDPGTPQGPGDVDNPAPPATAHYAGVYATVAPLDFTQNGVLPGVIGPALSALIELHDHPGQAILDIVVVANIPDVSDLVKNMPSFLKDLLSSLLDKLIIDEVYANVPVVDQITTIISGVTELAKTIDVHSSLTVHTPKPDESVAIDHQVTDVGFTLLNNSTVIAFDANEKAMAHTSMTGTVKPHANAPVADADLTLAGGTMTLPFGELLLQAAGPLLFSQFGGATDLNGALNNLVDCAGHAQEISDALGGYLSPALVQNLCTAALGVLADQVTSRIDAIVLSDVQVSAGTAYLLDVSQSKPQPDDQSDRISQGKWSWSFIVAGGTATVPSTFAGDRIGDAQ